ncbi:MAG TPA: DUF434 domain-containing protein [Thermodesulfobacteriota bacterium]|nr:DUF434 domain-containing protein [Thermodesulfobacteriota bacterium]
MVNIEKVISASRDYLYLKRRKYSTRSILEIVGNHYQLNTEERNVLYRGFFIKSEIKSRVNKVLNEKQIKEKILKVDGYNQIITIESYRKGNFVFVAKDGIVRDSASVHRSYKLSAVTEEILNKLFRNLPSLDLKRVEFYFDRPVSFSGRLCEMINELVVEYGIDGRAETADSPDYVLKNAELVATSDSIIMAKAETVFDLAGWFLKREWKAKLPDFRQV